MFTRFVEIRKPFQKSDPTWIMRDVSKWASESDSKARCLIGFAATASQGSEEKKTGLENS